MLGDHGAAILLARNELALRATIASDCQPLHGLVRTMLSGLPRHSLPARRHARRPGHGAERDSRNPRASASAGRRQRCRCARCAAPARFWGSIRSTWPTKASWWRWCPPEQAEAALAAMRAHPAGVGAAIVGEVIAGEPRRRHAAHRLRRRTRSSTCWSASSCRGSVEAARCTSSASPAVSWPSLPARRTGVASAR